MDQYARQLTQLQKQLIKITDKAAKAAKIVAAAYKTHDRDKIDLAIADYYEMTANMLMITNSINEQNLASMRDMLNSEDTDNSNES